VKKSKNNEKKSVDYTDYTMFISSECLLAGKTYD
jgi:hypothetical protein